MPNTSFIKRLLEVHITLRAGEFREGANTKIITGVPLKVNIDKTGPPDFCKAAVEMQGILYEDLEKLSTLAFKPLASARNQIAVYAGDGAGELAVAFKGEITQAAADFNTAPDVVFKLECMTGYIGNITAQGPTAVKGNQAAADFIAAQAEAAGYTFQNNGVAASLNNCIFNGSPVAQARAAADQIGAELLIDDDVMILNPAGADTSGGGGGNGSAGGSGNAVLLNKDTGLLGYPTLTSEGVELKSLYNPEYRLGGLVKVETIVPKAAGVWRITKLTHELEAFNPSGGPWESRITGYPVE